MLCCRPADVLVPKWSLSHPAAFDLKVIDPLNTDLILEASLASGNSAECGEVRKHAKNDEMCSELGWTCIPLVVEVYGGWGCEAQECFSRLSKRLAMQMGLSDNEALSQIYSLVLHATVQAIVADPQCTDLTSNCWYLDDGVLAGTRASLIRALEVIQEHSVSSGLSLNYSKCELYSLQNLDMFYHTISRSATPCFEILGAPI